jgi:hypothetical protein
LVGEGGRSTGHVELAMAGHSIGDDAENLGDGGGIGGVESAAQWPAGTLALI